MTDDHMPGDEPAFGHLGPFSDWPAAARAERRLFAVPESLGDFRRDFAALIDATATVEAPADARVDATWEADGVHGEEVSWSVGWGPRTRAFVLRPAGESGPLPGVVALHSHDGIKAFGKEKIADGPAGLEPQLALLREGSYGGRAFANELARRGHVVVAHDAFLWGSRSFPVPTMLAGLPYEVPAPQRRDESAADFMDRVALSHEHLVAKYCALLGTTVLGVIAREDRLAAAYLRARADVRPGGVAAIGLSGGGARSAVLAAVDDGVVATVVAGMMSTQDACLDRHVAGHSWMFWVPGLSRIGDWPDIAACRAPSPLLVQYLSDDALFPLAGMQAAHARIAAAYSGAPSAYTGSFYPGGHRFDVQMQDEAFDWLAEHFSH